MPALTQRQIELKSEREKNTRAALKKKDEALKKKELIGEDWKTILKKQMGEELAYDVTEEIVPKLEDIEDLYNYFDPIAYYNDGGNNQFQMDLTKFRETEAKFKQIIDTIDGVIDTLKNQDIGIKEENDKKNKEKDSENKEGQENNSSNTNSKKPTKKEKAKAMLELDGTTGEDQIFPVDLEGVSENDINKALVSAKKNSKQGVLKGKILQTASTYLNRFVPMYNKHMCSCCGKVMDLNGFYITQDIACSDRIDNNGNFHMHICKVCAQKLLMYFYHVPSERNIELAMQFLCASLNIYWDVDLFYLTKKDFEDNDRKGTLIGKYISNINKDYIGRVFMDSPFLTEEQGYSRDRIISIDKNEAPFEWTEEEVKNKKQVLRMVGYDPFEYEDDEDKKILYRDLLNILDEGMQNDFVKFQAGIQIVQSFHKIRKMNERQKQMEKNNAPLTELKTLSDLKSKELKQITDFSKDNGFSERYASAKAKGETSFTGILKQMNEKKFEDALVNKFDIATSASMQQAADISMNAIMKQLSLSEAEVWKVTQEQYEELVKIRREYAVLEEQLRKTKYELAETRMLMKQALEEQKEE